MATTTTKTPLFKPGDLVIDRQGRTANVLELKPAGYRKLQYIDGHPKRAEVHKGELSLVLASTVRPWKVRTP